MIEYACTSVSEQVHTLVSSFLPSTPSYILSDGFLTHKLVDCIAFQIEPQVELSKRDREWREEMMQQAKGPCLPSLNTLPLISCVCSFLTIIPCSDRQKLAELAKKDKQLGQVLEGLRSQENQLQQVNKDKPL